MSRGWMVTMGGFLLLWGVWELAENAGLVQADFSIWPLLLVFVGLGLVLSAVTGGGWGAWCACGPSEPREEDAAAPGSPGARSGWEKP